MMLPGAEYVAYVIIVLMWMIVSVLVGLLGTAFICYPLVEYFLGKTKIYNDREIGKIPPIISSKTNQRVWPWWSESGFWTKVGFWFFASITGYTFAGPALGLMAKIGGA